MELGSIPTLVMSCIAIVIACISIAKSWKTMSDLNKLDNRAKRLSEKAEK